MSKIKEVIFLDQYVTYCCLILGPATVGQYFYLQPFKSEGHWNSKKNYTLSQIWQNWSYALLLLRPRTADRNCGLKVTCACMSRVYRAWCLQLIKFQVTENEVKYVRISFCCTPINPFQYRYCGKKRISKQEKWPSLFLTSLCLFTELAAARALYGSSTAVPQQPTHPLASKNKLFDSSAAHAISPTKVVHSSVVFEISVW